MDSRVFQTTGYTLIELLISLALLSTVLLFALSSSPKFIRKNQLTVVIHEIKNAVHVARTQAISNGKPFTISSLTGTKDWSQGMMLIEGYPATSKIIQEWHWENKGLNISWHGFQSNQSLLFDSKIGHNAVNGYFIVRNNYNMQVKLMINRLGRVKEDRVDIGL